MAYKSNSKHLVDEILRNTDEDIANIETHNLNIDDILNENSTTTNSSQRVSYRFNPTVDLDSTLKSSQMISDTQDEEIDRLLKEAERVYPKKDYGVDPYSNYIESLNLGESATTEYSLNPQKHQEDEILPYKNPIEFVNYIETVYIKSQLEGNESVFQLKNYKQHAKIKFSVLDFIKKSTLSQRFYKGNNMVTAIAAQDDIILAGNNLGMIRMYSCEKEYEYKSYSSKEIDVCSKRSVVCMDISADGDFLITGYSNGILALWDLATTKCKKLITNAHNSCVIACQFVRSDKKKFEVISSDLDGNVQRMTIKDGLFSVSADIAPLITNSVPVFLIKVLKFTEEEKKMYDFCRLPAVIVALGSLESILVQMLEPEVKLLFQFDKPKYFKDNFVPDLSFGIGYPPNINEGKDKDLPSLEPGIIDIKRAIDYSQSHILLAITWGKIVYIYCLPILNNTLYGLFVCGHYINSAPIIRMGFLSNSILFFFDKQKFVKVINTSLTSPGDVKLSTDNDTPTQVNDLLKKPELEEGRIVDTDILFQTYLPDTVEKTTKATFNNFIINLPKNIFVLAKRDLYHGRLLNWEQCLNNLHHNSEWMDALTLGLDIYHGRTTALADIPIDEGIRKAKVGQFLKGLIHQYAIIHTGNDRGNVLSADTLFRERLSKCMNICIEFCIDIDAVDYLLTQLQPIFDSKGYGDDFIQKLEPFILCDKIINQQLGQMTISTIIDIYIRNKKFHLLSQMLIHLDIQSIDIDYVKQMCSQYNLITPLIYIYMNGIEEDYFFPLKKIFEIFENAKEIPKTIFISYNNCLKTMSTSDLEMSKQYVGHKLLWYVNLALNGKKFPGKASMSEGKFKILVVKLALWLLSDEVLPKLLNFDAFSLFIILTRIFSNEVFINIISSQDINSYPSLTGMTFNISGANCIPLSDIKPTTLVDLIVYRCKETNNTSVLQYLYEFISQIGGFLQLAKTLVIEALKFLLSYNFREKEPGLQNEESIFIASKNKEDFAQYIENMSNIIINVIESRKDLEKNDIFTLLSASELSQFVMVKIHLLKLNKNYKRSLEVYLHNDNRIKDREVKVFEWIEVTLKELSEKDMMNFESLKEEVLNRLHSLAELSIDNVTKLVATWFSQEQNVVIHKLDKAQPLQLKYVENILEKFKDDVDFSGENEKKLEQYTSLLKLHIKLLCKLNKKDLVLPNLRRRPSYPVDDCLKKCLKHKVYDAAIYLYQSTGAIKDALNLASDVLNATFQNIIANLSSSGFKDNVHTLLLEDHKNNLKQCIEICENNSDKTEAKEGEDMWFLMLRQLYKMLTVVKETTKDIRKGYFDELAKRLSGDIKDMLERMCSYVSIQMIIENVTENYKHAEFKEFKKLLLKMLSSYSHLKNILISAKNLLGNSVLFNVEELKKCNLRGNRYDLYKCDNCSKLFNHIGDEPLYIFRCGHKVHIRCSQIEEGEVICIICRKNEIESSLSTAVNVPMIKPRKTDMINFSEGSDSLLETVKKGKNDHFHSKLKAFDKHYIEKSSLVKI